MLDQLADEDLTEADRLEAEDALRILTAPSDQVTEKDRQRAGTKLKRLLTSKTWWQLAEPVLDTVLAAELKRHLGLPA